jgi:hypothetical protein
MISTATHYNYTEPKLFKVVGVGLYESNKKSVSSILILKVFNLKAIIKEHQTGLGTGIDTIEIKSHIRL